MSDYIKSILAKNPEFKNQLESVIDFLKMLKKEGTEEDFKSKINAMVEEVLNSLSQDPDLVDLKNMTPEAKAEFISEISETIARLVGSDGFTNKAELIELIVTGIIGRFSEKTGRKNQEFEYDLLDEKQKEQIEKEIKLAIIYETYQKMNPNRIAGESKMDNLQNNLRVGGVERAQQHEGSELLGKLKPSHVRKIINEGKDGKEGMGK